MDLIKLNDLRWRNYHNLSFPFESSLFYFNRDDLLINESLRFRILETLNALCELRNELYSQIRNNTSLKPIQRKFFD